jgi:hypothetical protein
MREGAKVLQDGCVACARFGSEADQLETQYFANSVTFCHSAASVPN